MVRSQLAVGRFKLLASAIAGRPLEVAPAPRGDPAWTDGMTLFLRPDGPIGEHTASVAVQSSLIAAGSLAPDVLDVLARRPATARRYLAVEGHRALTVQEHILPPSVRRLIDREVAGSTDSPASSLAIAASRAPLPSPPVSFGAIRPRRVRSGVGDRGASRSIHQHVPRREAGRPLAELDDDGSEDSAVDVLPSPVGGGGGLGRLLGKLFGGSRSSSGGPPGADSPTHTSRYRPRRSTTSVLSRAAGATSESPLPVERTGFTYPEWDAHHRRYRPEWCTVVESDPPAQELAAFRAPDPHSLRRPLGRLGMELERSRRQLQGDDIDVDAAVEAHVQLKAGVAPDESIYMDTVRRRRDLSVLVLLDISGSAAEPSATGLPVHHHQRTAAAALVAALYEMGDRVALYGFRSQGRSAVQITRVKRFGDDLDELVMQRLGGLNPGAYTRLGAAIRHGTAVTERDAGTSRRLLVVISDGLAYDHGYERAYGEADARKALAEARRRGIGSVCLSVGAGTDAGALRRVFGTAAHAAIPGVEQLPAVVGPLFRWALRSADQQRKVHQRRKRTSDRLGVERRTA